MVKAIEDHKISVTIATVAVVATFLFTTAFKLGAQQTEVVNKVESTAKRVEKVEEKQEEHEKVSSEIQKTLIKIQKDIEQIKDKLEKK